MIYNKNPSKFGTLESETKLFAGSAPLEGSLFQLSQKHTGAVFYAVGFFSLLMHPPRKIIIVYKKKTLLFRSWLNCIVTMMNSKCVLNSRQKTLFCKYVLPKAKHQHCHLEPRIQSLAYERNTIVPKLAYKNINGSLVKWSGTILFIPEF